MFFKVSLNKATCAFDNFVYACVGSVVTGVVTVVGSRRLFDPSPQVTIPFLLLGLQDGTGHCENGIWIPVSVLDDPGNTTRANDSAIGYAK